MKYLNTEGFSMRAPKTFLALMLTLLMTACAMVDYKTLPEDQHTFVKVEEVEMNKSELYLSIQQWFASNLGKSNEALQIQDKEAGILLGRMIIPNGLQDALGVSHDLHLNVKVEAKDNKYRITMSEFRFYFERPSRYVSTGAEYTSSMKTTAKLASDIYKHVTSATNDSDF